MLVYRRVKYPCCNPPTPADARGSAPGNKTFEDSSAAAAAGPAAELALFLPGSRRDVSSSSSRPSSCNRFVLNRIQKGRQASGQHVFRRSFRPSVAWCFGVAKGAFWRVAAPAPAALLAAAAGAAAAAVGASSAAGQKSS